MENADCAICEDCVYENNHPCPFEKCYYENLVFCLLKTVNDNSCEFFAFYHPSFILPPRPTETAE